MRSCRPASRADTRKIRRTQYLLDSLSRTARMQALDHLRSLTEFSRNQRTRFAIVPSPVFPCIKSLPARRGTSHSRRPYSYESYSRGPQSIWLTRIHPASKPLLPAISSPPLSDCPDAPGIFVSTSAPSESSTDPVEYRTRESLRKQRSNPQ